jgi:hypothetical protein
MADVKTPKNPSKSAAVGNAPLTADSAPGPVPGTEEHTLDGGTYPSAVSPVYTPAGHYFSSPAAMLAELKEYARTTHGLAPDKEMMTKVHDYLQYHLSELGFVEKDTDLDALAAQQLADESDADSAAATAKANSDSPATFSEHSTTAPPNG